MAVISDEAQVLRREVKTLGDKVERLKRELAVYEALLEITLDIPFSLATDGRLTYLGEQARALGIVPGEAVNRNLAELAHDDDVLRIETALSQSVRTGKVVPIEFRFASPNADTWLEICGKVATDESDTPTGISGVFRDVTDRKKSETALIESESRFRSIVEASPMGIHVYRMDPDGQLVFEDYNEAADRIMGVSNEQYLGKFIEEAFPAATSLGFADHYREVCLTGVPWSSDKVWYEDDQIQGAFQVHAFSTGPNTMAALFMDITARIRERQSLIEQEQKYRTLFENAGDAIFLMSPDQVFECNERALEMFACERSQLIGVAPYLFSPDIQPSGRGTFELAGQHIERALAGETHSFEWRHRTVDGHDFDTEVTLSPVEIGDEKLLLALVRNVDDRKRAEEQLRESEERLDLALKGGALALWDWDLTTGDVVVNDRWAEMLDYDLEDIQPSITFWESLVHPDDLPNVRRMMDEHRTGETESFKAEYRLRTKSGDYRWALIQGQVVRRDESGLPRRISGTQMDISEMKRLQEFAARAERLEAAGRIAGQVAHDLNNLLAPLTAYPELIKQQLDDQPNVCSLLDDMDKAATRIAEINQQLLTLGRRGRVNLRKLNINDAVTQALEHSGELPDNIQIRAVLASDIPSINADDSQLLRALSNLVQNACDAMPGGGELSVESSYLTVDSIEGYLVQVPPGDYVVLRITDTGCGIPADGLHRIFEPFVTTKAADRKRGSGLGLSVVHSVVQDHNGFVDCFSQVGEGTTFTIYLPAVLESDTMPPEREDDVPNEEAPPLALIVDTDPAFCKLAADALDERGYEVFCVESGADAIAALSSGTFALALVEMSLPGGMDGVDVFFKLHRQDADLDAVLFTGSEENARVKQASSLGAHCVTAKPDSPASLSSVLREICPAKTPVPAGH